MQSGERRSRVQHVRHHTLPKVGKARRFSIGVDDDLIHLRRDTRDHPFKERDAAKRDKRLFLPTHAARLSARDDRPQHAHAHTTGMWG